IENQRVSPLARVCDLHASSCARTGERRGTKPKEVSMASRPNLPPEQPRRFGGGSEEALGRESMVGPTGAGPEGGREGVREKAQEMGEKAKGMGEKAKQKASSAIESGKEKLAGGVDRLGTRLEERA